MKPRQTVARWALILLAVGALGAHASHYRSFLADDSLISLRYADRLIAGEGLTWTDGRPVEGYSNLLWILAVALLGKLGVDLVMAARILGFLGMGAVIVAVGARYAAPRGSAFPLSALAAGLLFFAGAAPVAVWTVGGLEQPLIAGALAWAIPLCWTAVEGDFRNRRAALGLSLLLGALCLTRPDGLLFPAAMLAAVLLGRPAAARRPLWTFVLLAASLPVLFYGGQLVFRLAYYHEWLPNTALVKLASSPQRLVEGLRYVGAGLLALAPLSFVALAFLCLGTSRRASRERFLPLALLTLVWLAYLAVVGGDIFAAYRHLVPIVVVFVYAIIEGSVLVLDWARDGSRRRGVLHAGLIGLALLTVVLQFSNQESRRAMTVNWVWKGRSLALTLKDAFHGQEPLLAVTAAGCLPYWSDLPSLDMLGLNDHYLPRHKPADFGSGRQGHELGDGAYVLRCAPDIIVFNVGSAPASRSGVELAANPAFREQYSPMQVRTATAPVYTALVWFRIGSEKIGMRRGSQGTTIPAYLLNAFPNTTAFLDEGRLRVAVDAAHPAGILLGDAGDFSAVRVVGGGAADVEPVVRRQDKAVQIILTTKSAVPRPIDGIILAAPVAAGDD